MHRTWRTHAAGVTLHVYAWREKGAPKIGEFTGATREDALAAEAAAAVQVAAAYAEARRGPQAEGTFSALCDAYERSTEFRRLRESTQTEWSRALARIRKDLGDLSLKALVAKGTRAMFLDWRDGYEATPRKADYGMQVASAVLSWAVSREKIPRNVILGVEGIYRSDRAEIVWTEGEKARLLAALTPDAARAVRFIMLTGFRRGDAIAAPWSAVNEERGVIAWKPSKSRGAKAQVAVLDEDLRALLAECPKRGPTILTTDAGRKWHKDGLGASFARARTKAQIEPGPDGKAKRLHDLRGTTATERVAKILADPDFRKSMGWEGEAVGAAAGYVDTATVIAMTQDRRSRRRID